MSYSGLTGGPPVELVHSRHVFDRPAEPWEADPWPTARNLARMVFLVEPDIVRVGINVVGHMSAEIVTPGYRMPEASRRLLAASVGLPVELIFTAAISSGETGSVR